MSADADALALRCEALEQRLRAQEQSTATLQMYMWALCGLVLAAIVVGAIEIGRVYFASEAQQWRTR